MVPRIHQNHDLTASQSRRTPAKVIEKRGRSLTRIGARLDPLSPSERSKRMSLVRGKNTGPERAVETALRALKVRFVSHVSDLPGQPDFVLRRRRTVIFVHGCFWHRHNCPNGQRIPRSRTEFWMPKLDGNRRRDIRIRRTLRSHRWTVLVIWECETRDEDKLRSRVEFLLQGRPHQAVVRPSLH